MVIRSGLVKATLVACYCKRADGGPDRWRGTALDRRRGRASRLHGPMNLIADLIGVEDRIAETRQRIAEQAARVQQFRATGVPPTTLDPAEKLLQHMIGCLEAAIAHKAALSRALSRERGMMLTGLQVGMGGAPFTIEDLPLTLRSRSAVVAQDALPRAPLSRRARARQIRPTETN